MKALIETIKRKWTEYLMEVIVIVIGILIAFALNNWSQNVRASSQELSLLRDLKTEFEDNLELFDSVRDLHMSKREAIMSLLYDDLEKFSIDELDKINSTATYGWTYNPTFSIYDAMVFSGRIELIRNEVIKVRVSKFKDLVSDYKEDEEGLVAFQGQDIFPAEINNKDALIETKFGLRDRTPEEAIKERRVYIENSRDPLYRNRLSFLILFLDVLLDEGVFLRKDLVNIIGALENEIDELSQ